MRWLVALLLAGCLGPVLTLPSAEPRGAHEWLCRYRSCPDEAMRIGGTVEHVSYDRTASLCNCDLIDPRGLAVWMQAPPHLRRH